MNPLDLQSEQYQPTGSISADGIKNQLGRPKFDRLTLLAREAVQNSWDARSSDDESVTFGMAGWDLNNKQLRWLLDVVFGKAPPKGLEIRQLLEAASPPAVLVIYDRGTRGLAGPTRADAVGPSDDLNFVNLLRNIGQPPAEFRGGGTYGFGKTALFLASRARTIVVHSQVAMRRGVEQRFMAAALGAQYTQRSFGSSKRYTGRHWWGRKGSGNVVDPLIGREAAEAARALGLTPFGKNETGTSIAIILPEFEGRTPTNALHHISGAILRSFWPKMVDGRNGAGTMQFELSWNGERIAMPRPQDVPPLDGFVKAFANLRAHLAGRKVPYQPASFHAIKSLRPRKDLGTLSLVRFPPSPRLESLFDEAEDSGPFAGPSRHTALMRGPHFVVNYCQGPPVPYEQAEYAGVFLASDEAEESFARSEPPTHDDWSPDMLDNRSDKVFVRVAMRRVTEAMAEFTGATATPQGGSDGVPLGAFSDFLGGLIPAEQGTGARPNGGVYGESAGGADKGGGAGGPGAASGKSGSGNRAAFLGGPPQRGPRVRILESGDLESISGLPAFTVRFDLEPEQRTKPVAVSAAPMVLLEEGALEVEAPAGSQRPRILFWSNPHGGLLGKSEKIDIAPSDKGPWLVTVAIPPDAAVALELTAREA